MKLHLHKSSALSQAESEHAANNPKGISPGFAYVETTHHEYRATTLDDAMLMWHHALTQCADLNPVVRVGNVG